MLASGESRHPVFRATSPLSRGQLKSKGGGKLSIHYCADLDTIKTVFRRIISVNQLCLCGAVAETCEEYETFHDRTEQPVVGDQSSSSFVPSVIKTEVPLDCDDLVRKDLLLQPYGERIEKLSQQDKLSKFCMDAGFLNVVEIGQYFMTKDTAEFSQLRAAACREYTLPRDEEASEPTGWIRGNTKIGPVLEVATCCLHGKYGVEIRIMSMNKDNSHSWVRISQGSSKFVTNLNNNEQELSEVQLEEYALKLNAMILHGDQRPKQNHKDEKLPVRPQEQYLLEKEFGPMSNQENIQSPISLFKEDDGAIEFWRIKDNLQKYFLHCHHWSDDKWKKNMAGGGGNKKDTSIVLIHQE